MCQDPIRTCQASLFKKYKGFEYFQVSAGRGDSAQSGLSPQEQLLKAKGGKPIRNFLKEVFLKEVFDMACQKV